MWESQPWPRPRGCRRPGAGSLWWGSPSPSPAGGPWCQCQCRDQSGDTGPPAASLYLHHHRAAPSSVHPPLSAHISIYLLSCVVKQLTISNLNWICVDKIFLSMFKTMAVITHKERMYIAHKWGPNIQYTDFTAVHLHIRRLSCAFLPLLQMRLLENVCRKTFGKCSIIITFPGLWFYGFSWLFIGAVHKLCNQMKFNLKTTIMHDCGVTFSMHILWCLPSLSLWTTPYVFSS